MDDEHNSTSPSGMSSPPRQPRSTYVGDNRHYASSNTFSKPIEPKIYYITSGSIDDIPLTSRSKTHGQTPYPLESERQSNKQGGLFESQILAQPILYSIGNEKPNATVGRPIVTNRQQTLPTMYSMNSATDHPAAEMNANKLETSNLETGKSPIIYSVANTSNLDDAVQEPNKQVVLAPPMAYSIVGNPARTSRGIQVDLPSPFRSVPIVYTIVGDSPPTESQMKENLPPIIGANQTSSSSIYSDDNKGDDSRIQPAFYSIVSDPKGSKRFTSRPPARKPSPPPLIYSERANQNLQQNPDAIKKDTAPSPAVKSNVEPTTKDVKPVRSETLFIPLNDEERRTRPQVPNQSTQMYTNPESTSQRPQRIIYHHRYQYPEYQSPYAYRPQKQAHERKTNIETLPVISNQNTDRRVKQSSYEAHSRYDPSQFNTKSKAKSLERNPINNNARLGLWDVGYHAQTDDEDDDAQRNKKKRSIKSTQPRAPWVPVW